MKELEALKALLSTPKKIIITTHSYPDADALGSSLGLCHFLKGRGHEVKVITPTDYPEFLHWMYGNDEVLIYDQSSIAKCEQEIATADLVCCLDFSSLKRIRNLGPMVTKTSAKKLIVDHHLNPESFADYTFWDCSAGATAELIYDLILMMDGQEELTVNIAECLYAGIMTDTGSFTHNSTSAKIHRMVAELMEAGADVNKISRLIYDAKSLNQLRFLGYALMERLVVDESSKVAYFVISAEDHERFQLKTGDTEGLVNYALSIQGIMVAAIIMDRCGEVKLSFRSVGVYSVNDFAEEYFNGGGHRNAAGGISDLGLVQTVEKFISLIPKLQLN